MAVFFYSRNWQMRIDTYKITLFLASHTSLCAPAIISTATNKLYSARGSVLYQHSLSIQHTPVGLKAIHISAAYLDYIRLVPQHWLA